LCFSPAVGLLAQCSPQFTANLRTCDWNTPAAQLSKELFHQRADSFGRRYGPVSITKSRSKAAYWITPSAVGCMVGIAAAHSLEGAKVSFDKLCRGFS
jgi:hypothetical protein